MEFKRLILALKVREYRKPLNPYANHFPPVDKRRERFQAWQRKRKESQLHKGLAETVTDPCLLCACGALKPRAATMCFECKDMLSVIAQKIPPQTVLGDAAQRYEMPPLSVYDECGHDRHARKHIDDADPAQENGLRALEDG